MFFGLRHFPLQVNSPEDLFPQPSGWIWVCCKLLVSNPQKSQKPWIRWLQILNMIYMLFAFCRSIWAKNYLHSREVRFDHPDAALEALAGRTWDGLGVQRGDPQSSRWLFQYSNGHNWSTLDDLGIPHFRPIYWHTFSWVSGVVPSNRPLTMCLNKSGRGSGSGTQWWWFFCVSSFF